MHSYREAFEDSEADRITHSPTYGGGGENFPQTPRLPVTPQTLYFTTCRSALSKSLNSPVFAFFFYFLYAVQIKSKPKEQRGQRSLAGYSRFRTMQLDFHIQGSISNK